MIQKHLRILPLVLLAALLVSALFVAARNNVKRTTPDSTNNSAPVVSVAAAAPVANSSPVTETLPIAKFAPGKAYNILGLQLNMDEEEAERQLKKIGKREREEGEEEEREEIWAVKDARFSHVIVGFGEDEKVRYVTAVTRAESTQKMRYSDIGSTDKAQQKGDPQHNNFHYVWEFPAQGKQPHYLVVARGRDAQFLETYSIKRL